MKTQAELQTELDFLREQSSRALSANARDELLRLGEDLPRLWHHPGSSVEIKKRILRIVIKEIVVTKKDDTIRALVHWQGGDHTEIVFEKSHTGDNKRSYLLDRKCKSVCISMLTCDPEHVIGFA